MLGIILAIFILIFPLKLSVYFNFKSIYKRLFFKIKFFNIITIFNGYIEIVENRKININLPFNKVVKIPFNKLFKFRNNLNPVKDYLITKSILIFEFGSKRGIEKPLAFSFLLNYFYTFFYQTIKSSKPYIDIKNAVYVYENQQLFNFYLKFNLTLNLLTIIFTIIKIFMEKVINEFAKSRQQNKSSS